MQEIMYTLHHEIAALRSQRRVSGWALIRPTNEDSSPRRRAVLIQKADIPARFCNQASMMKEASRPGLLTLSS
ncbi:MAG: hypothetical protein ACI92E_001264 [Oceanicoccus sp.]|jgi:hypothetical protein